MFLIYVLDTIEPQSLSLDALITHPLLMFGRLVVLLLNFYLVNLCFRENLE